MYRACVCNIHFLVHPINQYCSCESSSIWFCLWSQVDSLPTTCNRSWISPTLWVFSSHYSSGRRSMWNILDTNQMQKYTYLSFHLYFYGTYYLQSQVRCVKHTIEVEGCRSSRSAVTNCHSILTINMVGKPTSLLHGPIVSLCGIMVLLTE